MKNIKSRLAFINEILLSNHGSEEKVDNKNIYSNKYWITTVHDPIIPDAISIISQDTDAVKFTNKEEFDKFADTQKYFSASSSWCFYTPEEHNAFSMKAQQPCEDAKKSELLFETGHRIVQVWDNKNQVGYILPADKVRGKLN